MNVGSAWLVPMKKPGVAWLRVRWLARGKTTWKFEHLSRRDEVSAIERSFFGLFFASGRAISVRCF